MTDDLETIRGVGPAIAEKLRDAGYGSADEVLNATPDELAEVPLIGESSARALSARADGGQPKSRPPEVDEHLDAIAELATKPISDRGVIRLSDIGWSTHKDWMSKDGDVYARYRETWEQARGEAEAALADEVAKNDPRFLLERAFGYTKEQKIEHQGDAANVTIDFNDVDT